MLKYQPKILTRIQLLIIAPITVYVLGFFLNNLFQLSDKIILHKMRVLLIIWVLSFLSPFFTHLCFKYFKNKNPYNYIGVRYTTKKGITKELKPIPLFFFWLKYKIKRKLKRKLKE